MIRKIGYVYLSAALTIMFMDSYSRSLAAGVPVGTIIWSECEIAPEGFLARDGSEVSRTAYARLFALIGTRYGEGDGSTTFNVGDLRDCFIRGAGGTLGAAPGTLQLDAAPNITGQVYSYIQVQIFPGGNGAFIGSRYGSYRLPAGADYYSGNTLIDFSASRSAESYGRDGTTEVRPRNYSLYPYIKF